MKNSNGDVTEDMKILWERCVTCVRIGSGRQTYLGGWVHLLYPFTKEGELLKVPDVYAPLDTRVPDPDKTKYDHYTFEDVEREFYLTRGWESIAPSVFSCEAKYFRVDKEFDIELKSGFVGSVYDGTHFIPAMG